MIIKCVCVCVSQVYTSTIKGTFVVVYVGLCTYGVRGCLDEYKEHVCQSMWMCVCVGRCRICIQQVHVCVEQVYKGYMCVNVKYVYKWYTYTSGTRMCGSKIGIQRVHVCVGVAQILQCMCKCVYTPNNTTYQCVSNKPMIYGEANDYLFSSCPQSEFQAN